MSIGNMFTTLGKVHAFVLTMVLAVLFLVSCGEDNASLPTIEQPPAPKDAVVAATVNGYTIYLSDIQMEAEAQGYVAPGERVVPERPYFTRVLNGLIDDHLLARAAEREGLHRDPFVQHRIKVIRDRILGSALLAEGVDESMVQRYYDTSIASKQITRGEEFRIRQIVLPTREMADALLKELQSDSDFAVIASNRSIDPITRLEGGDLGFVNPETAREELAQAILTTPIGGVSTKPFETEMGWHVIKVEEKRPEPLPTLADLRPQIYDFLVAKELERVLEKLHSKASILRSFDEFSGPDIDPFSQAPEQESLEEGAETNDTTTNDREL